MDFGSGPRVQAPEGRRRQKFWYSGDACRAFRLAVDNRDVCLAPFDFSRCMYGMCYGILWLCVLLPDTVCMVCKRF